MTSTPLELLRQHCGKYRFVKIERRDEDARTMCGYVLGVSDSLVLLSAFQDFHPDGCCVVRIEDIDEVRVGGSERAFERMFAAEGLLDAVGVAVLPPLDSMKALLTHLMQSQQAAILEVEFEAEDPDDDVTYESMEAAFESAVGDLRSARAAGKSVDEWLDEDEEDDEVLQADAGFLIGRIVRVEDRDCWVHHFDAEGEWDAEPTPMAIADITSVQIGGPYLETWLRHIAPFPGDAGQAD
jgi:hypothetical protein